MRTHLKRSHPPLALRLLSLLLFVALLFASFAFSVGTIHIVTNRPEIRHDFQVFFAAAENIATNPKRVYDQQTMIESISRSYGVDPSESSAEQTGWFRYYNPPFYLYLLTPLTLLDFDTAALIFAAINLVAVAALVFLLGVTLRWRQPFALLTAVGTTAFVPLHFAIFHSQPNILIAVAITGAFLAAERGNVVLSSLLLMFAAVKPQWLVLQSLALLRHKPTALTPLVLLGGLVLLGPFLFLGFGALVDYVSVLTERTGSDMTGARYSAVLHNWIGFFRALTGTTQPALAIPASLLTLAILAAVFLRGERELTWSAAIFATIIVAPHSHTHEWVLALPAGAILLRRPMMPSALAVTSTLLLIVYLGATAGVIANSAVFEGGRFLYWSVPGAFAIVVWCAVLPLLERRLPSFRRHGVALPVAAS